MIARTVWLWRAWAKDRSRICDCGTVNTVSDGDIAEAKSIAWATLAGPWQSQVVEIQVERIGTVMS